VTQVFRFGILRSFSIPIDDLVGQIQRFESAGFDSVWGIDHFNRPTDPGAPLFESWTTLAALAAVTTRIRLGILVTSNTFRHPALVAKEAVTIDHISHGRVEIGLGAGGYEAEHHTFGLPYPDPAERVARLRESVEAIDALMRQEVTTYRGRFIQLTDAPFRPGPVQRPRPPITIAASGTKMLELAARHADRWNAYGTVDEMREKNATIDRACAEIGRNPSEIIRSLYLRSASLGVDPWKSESELELVIAEYRAAGVNEFIFEPPRDDQWPAMDAIAAGLLARLRRA
jgi:alkanesulfonate monooxygenase SsuD/methylene tetrahydromethanopterin reductase-like flavin-dependent oxidoreductase (luciferase family)